MKTRWFWIVSAVGLVTAAGMSYVLVRWSTAPLSVWVDEVGEAVPPLMVAAPLCVWAGLRLRGARRYGWIALGASAFVWALGEGVYTYLYSVAQPCASLGTQCPNPSFADLFFLSAVPLGIVGLLLIPGKPRSPADLLRQVLDGLLIGGSVLFVSWAFALKDLYSYSTTSGLTMLATIVGLAYPISDVSW